MVLERGFDVQEIDDHRDDGDDARIHRRRRPRRPAALDEPATTKRSIRRPPASGRAQKSIAASIARTALFVIGSRGTQVASPVLQESIPGVSDDPSSRRDFVSPEKVSGSLGTCWRWTVIESVATAMRDELGIGRSGHRVGVASAPI